VKTRALSALYLRRCTGVGKGVVCEGRPHIDNQGRMEIGDGCVLLSSPVRVHLVTAAGASLRLGESTVISHGVGVTAHERVEIGNRVSLGPFSMVHDTDFHDAADRRGKSQTAPIVIGDNVRIGARVTLLKATRIGEGATILSGSVVSGQVPAGATYGGNPARPMDATAHEGDVDLAELVRRTLGLPSAPLPSDGPQTLSQWDSLGALRLLLTLEEHFSIRIGEAQLARARNLKDLARIVSAAEASARAR
jgi:acetyltransferase-like isoleucine patch superfamily enzyme/acyl carrier protein